MKRRSEPPAHRYIAGPSLYTRGDNVIVRHRPRCRCGWESPAEYSDADVAKAAWAAHKDRSTT